MNKTSKLKLFGKIHLFDLIVFFLLLVMLFGVGNRLTGGKLISSFNAAAEKKVEVVLRTREYPLTTLNAIEIGEKLSENKQYLDGEVKAVKLMEREVSYLDDKGQVVLGNDPYYKWADVTIVATMKYNEPVYSLGKQEYVAGSNVFLTTTRLNLKSVVMSVKELE